MSRYDTPPYYITAYGLAVKHGFKGTEEEWLESLKASEIEIRYLDGMLQWRRIPRVTDDSEASNVLEDDETENEAEDLYAWHDLIDIADIRGEVIEQAMETTVAAAELAKSEAEKAAGAKAIAEAANEKADHAMQAADIALGIAEKTQEAQQKLEQSVADIEATADEAQSTAERANKAVAAALASVQRLEDEQQDIHDAIDGKLPQITGAKPGQYPRIAEVDEQGWVVALEAADAPVGGAVTDEQITQAVSDYMAEHPVSGNGIASAFSGLTASFYGDSLTEENGHYAKGYHSWLKDLLGLASYNNYAHSGYKVSDVYNKIRSTVDKADLVFVMCGVNDQTFSVPLGKLGDSTTGTTYGALDLLCATLKQKYPTSVVVFITPHYQTKYPHSEGITSYEISKAAKEVCEKYAIPVYDNFAMSGIYNSNFSAFTTDNCHWNTVGHELVGKNLARFMLNNFGYAHGATAADGEETTVPVTGVTLNKTTGVLTEGEVVVLTATVAPVNATNKSVKWVSNNENVAKVANGVVTAISEGSATITVTTNDGGFTANYVLTVEKSETEVVTYSVVNQLSNVTNNNPAVTVGAGDSYTATLTADDGYRLDAVSVSMGGVDITSTAYAGDGVVSIETVTGAVIITATAVEDSAAPTLNIITSVFEQGELMFYDNDSLDALRDNLKVVAVYSDGSTDEVTDYTLSGTLSPGNSEITVSYSDKATTFSVAVTDSSNIEKSIELTGEQWDGGFHLGLYVTAGTLPNISNGAEITYGFTLEPLTEFIPSSKNGGGLFSYDTPGDLYAGYTQIYGQKAPTINDNGDGTYAVSITIISNEETKVDRDYWGFLTAFSVDVGNRLAIKNPYVRIGGENQPIRLIGGGFSGDTFKTI